MTYNEKIYGYIKTWRATHKPELHALQQKYNKQRIPSEINAYNNMLYHMKKEKKIYFNYDVESKRFLRILL